MLKQTRGIPLIFKSRSSTHMLNVLEVSGSMTIYCVRDFDKIFIKSNSRLINIRRLIIRFLEFPTESRFIRRTMKRPNERTF